MLFESSFSLLDIGWEIIQISRDNSDRKLDSLYYWKLIETSEPTNFPGGKVLFLVGARLDN